MIVYSTIRLPNSPSVKTKQFLTDALPFLTAPSASTSYPACRNAFPIWRVMSYWRTGLGRSSTTVLVAATILCLHPRSVAAQDLQAKPASPNRPDAAPSSVFDEKSQPTGQDDSLPDAPLAAGQVQEQAQDSAAPSVQTALQQPNELPVLPPTLTRTPLTGQDKFLLYIHKSFGPPAVILPAFGACFQMLNPPNHYPRDWKDGADAFGRNYGYRVADRTSRETAQFLTGFLLHEDPRYQRSTSTNTFRRTFHALAFTVVDKRDSGRNTLAVSNFAAAAAGGFVGLGILPNGYNDITHAEQHMASEFLQIAIGNVAAGFEPQWGPWVEKIHLPKILPAWWVLQHSHQP